MADIYSPLETRINPEQLGNDVLMPKDNPAPVQDASPEIQNPPDVDVPGQGDGADTVNPLEGFDPAAAPSMSDVDPENLLPPERKPEDDGGPSNEKALETIGVKWADHGDETVKPKNLFDRDVGFYELDYDPTGAKGVEMFGTTSVQAANVFGRQFTRAELDRHEEGRKLVSLMEGIRSGAFRDQGFAAGLTNVDRTNIPFLGNITEIGTSVSEAIDISSAMRKMQRGEAVTDDEALGVRRFMLQQEIESGRTFGYGVGSVIRQAPTFMAEMALAGKVMAASTAIGAGIGGVIGGIVTAPTGPGAAAGAAAGATIGGKIGAGVGFVLTMGATVLNKITGAIGKRMASRAVEKALGDFTTRTIEKGFTAAEGQMIRKAVGTGSELFSSATKKAIREEMAKKLGEGATKQAVAKAANFEMYRRAAASVVRPTLFGKSVDVNLATRMAVQGDVKNLVSGEFARGLEAMAIKLGSKEGVSASSLGYFAKKKALKAGWKQLDDATIAAYRKGFINGTVESMGEGLPRTELARGVMSMGGGADRLVAGSMSQVLGKSVTRDNSFARAVAERIVDNQLKSMQLKYAGKGMFNGVERLGRYVGDHALNGLLRWDMSAFGGPSGTIARSGSVLGGKMAALKEAVGVACIEAPVRGALQLGIQTPMWPVAAGISGRNPGDFVIRGQLGTQATALRTGDTDMMDNARAIAFGSLLVEYASENAGRGLETFAGGVIKPVWKSTFLARPTERVGSFMAQKINAMFGFDKMMLPAHNQKLTGYVAKTLRNRLTGAPGGDGVLSRLTEQEIKKLVETRSLNGASDAMKEALSKAGFRNVRDLLVGSVTEQAKITKWRAATQYMMADYMMRKGFTPQKFNALLERVGYDGVIAEMAEERYGGFLQGLFGLNDRPSDEGWSGRWKAAMEGLFPDREQLLTEAIAFSVPSVASISMQHLYSSIGEGGGGMSDLQADLATLRSSQSPHAAVSIPGVTAEYAERLRDGKAKLDSAPDAVLGTKEDNVRTFRESVIAGARSGGLDAASTDEAKGRLSPIRDARNDGEMGAFADELGEELSKVGTYDELQKRLAELGGEAMFGKDGIAAAENMWRRRSGQSLPEGDAREAALKAAAAEYETLLGEAPAHSGPVDVSDVLHNITVQLGIGTADTGNMEGAERRGGERLGANTNLFDDNVTDEVAGAMAHLGKTAYGMERGMRKNLSLPRRAAMRLVGIVDGLTTGNWSLASANPIQYAYEDMSLPRDMMGRLMNEYRGCLDVARRQLTQSHEKITEARMEEIADEIMSQRTKSYAAAFLAASNVLAVSKSDLSEAALRVVAYRNLKKDGTYGYSANGTDRTTADFRDPAFSEAHLQDVEQARRDIVSTLARSTVNGIIAANQHSAQGHREAIALNLSRAMQAGTNAEIMCAISELPAFRSLHKVYDVSDFSQEYSDVINSGLFGRVLDTSVIENVPTGRDAVLTPEQVGSLNEAMGRDMTLYTEEENMEAAKRFAAQVKAVVDSGLNVRFEDRRASGTSARQVSVVRNPVTGEFTVTYEEAQGGAVRTERAAGMNEVVSMLDAAGFDAVSKRIVFTTNKSITFSDALSGVMFLNQDNLVAARREMIRNMGLEEGTFDEELLPHILRVDPVSGRMGFYDGNGKFVSTENDAGRMAAVDAMRAYRRAADRAERTGTKEDERARAIVYGGNLNGQSLSGWDRAAEKIVTARGAVRSMEDDAARAAGLTTGWSFRPGSLPCGDTLVIMRDYDNHVDSEALLRTALSQGMRSGFSRTPPEDRLSRDTILSEMAREFRKAADDIISGLDSEKDAEQIDAIRAAVSGILGEEGSVVNLDGLAAIASACVFFTSERGLAEDGNGYMYQAEIAAIADRARESEVFPYFMSVVDELLGGNGLFTVERSSVSGLARLRDAFAPSGDSVRRSRESAMFAGGQDGRITRECKRDPGAVRLNWSKEGLLSGVNSPHDVVRSKFVDVSGYLASVADPCHSLASGFEQAFGRPPASTAEVYRVLHAAKFAGNTSARASVSSDALGSDEETVRPAGVKSRISAAAASTATTVRGLSSDEIGNRTAVSMARNFSFLLGSGSTRDDERRARTELERFLNARGMSAASRAKVLAAFSIVAARKVRYGERAAEAAEAVSDNEKELEAKSEGANADIFLENERRDAMVENDDLMECGEQLRYVFPTEATNYTAILYRLRQEITELARRADDMGHGGDNPFAVLSSALNVFGTPRDSDVVSKIAGTESFADDKVTDVLLDSAIEGLDKMGRTDLAFALSTIRNIPRTQSRRTKALRLIGQMTPVSGFYVQQDGTGFVAARQGTKAARASVDAMRAIVSAPFFGSFVRGAVDRRTGESAFGTRLAALNNFISGDAKSFEKFGGDYAWFNGATIDDVRSLLGAASKEVDAASFEFLDGLKDVNVRYSNQLHGQIVEYVNGLAERMAGTADAIERMFGYNEVCYVLRNPSFREYRIRELERLLGSDDAELRTTVIDGYKAELDNLQPGKSTISRFMNGTFMWPVFLASRIATGRGGPAGFYALNGQSADKVARFMNALRGEATRLATRGILKGSIKSALKDNVFDTATYGRMQSPLSMLVSSYAASMPRSTEVLTGKGTGGFRDAERTTMMPASPAPSALSVEDRILAGVGALDGYLANGGRFSDGSLLVQVSLGAKNRFGEIMDERFQSQAVNEANKAGYIVRNDCSYLRFQLYHGEKPTSYSIQLPGDVAQVLFEKAMAERDMDPSDRTLFPSHVPSGIDLDTLSEVKDIRDVEGEPVREQVYRFLYAAVAAAARCDQISPKRVQILMSQGTMTAAYRDRHLEVSDGNVVEVDDREGGVVPGHHITMSVGGRTGTSMMGMWMDHGFLVDALRAMSTNPKAMSFKTHDYAIGNAFFQKGQGHDLGVGVVPVLLRDGKFSLGKSRYGRTANAAMLDLQRRMRETVAEAMGLRGESARLLEPVTSEEFDSMQDDEKKARYDAYAAYRRFCSHSTVRGTDAEANKAGPFGSECGVFTEDGIFSISHEKYGTLYFDAKAGTFSDSLEEPGEDGVRRLSKPRKVPSFSMEPEVKFNAVPILWAVSAYMKSATKETTDAVTGEKRIKALSASDVGKLVTTWRRPDGTVAEDMPLKDTGIFSDYGTENGDRLSVSDDGDSATVRFFTRSDVSQIVANSDASAEASTESPYATNALRDTYLNETRRVDAAESVSAIPDIVTAATVNRLVNFASLLVNAETLVDGRVAKDEELARNLERFPFDLQERNREFRKRNSIYARAMRLPVYSTHGILLPTGGHVVKADTIGHDVVIEWAPGMDEFTKDMLRISRFYGSAERDFYGMGQSYSSGQVNILDDGSFRYGMAVDRARLDDFVKTFGKAIGLDTVRPDARLTGIVGADDAYVMSVVAKCIERFRDRSCRGANTVLDVDVVRSSETLKGVSQELSDAFGAAFGTGGLATDDTVVEERERGVAVNPFAVFLGCFTDYTGMHLNDRGHRDVYNMSFEDLFNSDGTFDYAAIDRRTCKLGDGKEGDALFVGGSFFSGSRRPSGNIEAASGFCRATMPVVFDESGTPLDCAMYALDPLVAYVQGSDTDGDSASIIIGKPSAPAEDLASLRALATLALSKFNSNREVLRGDYSAYREATKSFYREARARYPQFFDEDGSVSERFSDAIANMVFDAELENARKSPAFHQGPSDGKVSGIPEGFSVYRMSEFADRAGRPVPNVGAAGRRPVGPGIVGGELTVGQARAKKYRKYGVTSTMSYKAAFAAIVNGMNPERIGGLGSADSGDMLNPDVAAARSDAAADANGARGVMVALQATIEHVSALAANDPTMRKLLPALLEPRSDGYDPRCDFIGHLDGVSNALFDVVKDLFAPRAGWQKDILNHMIGRFLKKANDDYARDPNVRFDDAWFFDEAVSFLEDALDPSTYTGSLMYAIGDISGTGEAIRGQFDVNAQDTVLDAMFDETGSRRYEYDPSRQSYDSYLAQSLAKAVPALKGEDAIRKFRSDLNEAYGVPVNSKAVKMLVEMIEDPEMSVFGVHRDLMLARALMTPISDLSKRSNGITAAYEEYVRYRTINRLRIVETNASPDKAFRGGNGELGSYNRANELDRESEDRPLMYSEDNIAKQLINLATGTNMKRLSDELFDVLDEASEMRDDLKTIGTLEDSGSATPLVDWADRASVSIVDARSADWEVASDALELVRESLGRRSSASESVIAGNREMLHHVIGAIRELDESAAETAGALFDDRGTEGFRKFVAAGIERIMANAFERGMYSDDVRTLLSYVMADPRTGDIEFLSRPSSEDARAVQRGFEELVESTDTVSVEDNELPVGELAQLFQLHAALSGRFSGATDPRIRPNTASFFTPDRINRMEVWGTGVFSYPATRILCNLGTERGSSSFNLGYKSGDRSVFSVLLRIVGDPAVSYARAYTSRRTVLNATAIQARDVADDGRMNADNGFRAEGVGFQLTGEGLKFRVGGRGAWRVARNKRAFDTLEAAYNDLLDQVVAAHFGTDGLVTGAATVTDLVDGVSPRGLISYTGLDELDTMKRILLSTLNGPDGSALRKAINDLDPRVLDFSRAVDRVPGVTRRNSPALLACREYLQTRAAEGAGQVRASVSEEAAGVRASERMARGGFRMSANRGANVVRNVTEALETAFGKWSDEGGVRVTRVKRGGRNIDLLKVDRRFRTKDGVKTVTTYISFSGKIDVDYAVPEITESLFNALKSRGYSGTLGDLKGMSSDELRAVADSLGLGTHGLSIPSGDAPFLDTQGLLMLTGVIRLDDGAGLRTLFHEYFHQAYSFFRKTGVLSDLDADELTRRFSAADGSFDEEAAADAFADFVTDVQDGEDRRLSSSGKGVNAAFARMYNNCKAYLEGFGADDLSGSPAFMRILVTGDLSSVDVDGLRRRAEDRFSEVENALVGMAESFRSVTPKYYGADYASALAELASAIRGGSAAKDVKDLASKAAAVPAVQFRAETNDPMTMETQPSAVPAKRRRTRRKTYADETTELGRMQVFFRTALDRFGADSVPVGLDMQNEIRRMREHAFSDDLTAEDVGQLEATARRVIMDTADFLNIRMFERDANGNAVLTESGRKLLSDDSIAEMTIRLCHKMNEDAAAENAGPGKNPSGLHATHASADRIYGRMLAEVAPEKWPSHALRRIDDAAAKFREAAAKLRAKADAIRPSDPSRASRMEYEAVSLESAAFRMTKAFKRMLNGAMLHEVQEFKATGGGADAVMYGNLFDGVTQTLMGDGRKVYEGGKYSADATSMPEFQEAFDMASTAFFSTACARSYLRKIGRDFAPVGAVPEVPAGSAAPDPGYLIDSADTSAQMILQSPGSWLASDMLRDFMGTDAREMLTDHDIKAKTESANSLASTMDFVFAADCRPGERAREIDFVDTDVKFDDTGIDVHDERLRHTVMRTAAVRGYALGLVNRDARRAGREFTAEDEDTVNFTLQVVKSMACGDDRMLTGIDLPWPNRATLNRLLDYDVKGLLAGPLSRESVMARVNRYRGERATSDIPLTDGAMPCNIDHLFYRMYEAIPQSYLDAGLIEDVTGILLGVARESGRDTGTAASGDARDRLATALCEAGYADMSGDGRCVLAVPVQFAKRAWTGSDTHAALMEAGRTAGMLNLDYWAARIASESNALHRVAAKSRFMRGTYGRGLTSAGACGVWFHHGSGAHALNVERYENAKDVFYGKPSADEKMDVAFSELKDVLLRYTSADPDAVSKGRMPAFGLSEPDARGYVRVNGQATHRQIQFLIKLMSRYGVTVRDRRGRLVPLHKNFNPTDFVEAVLRGDFSYSGRSGLPVYLDSDSTFNDFARAIYVLTTQAVSDEMTGVRTGIDGLGTTQGLIDANELASRLEAALGEHDRGRVIALTPRQMFRMNSLLGSSMTASQNLRAMCEEIVTAERYKGCMTQMLQTVGPDGAMNYIVKPTEQAGAFLPDEYWGALARFTYARNRGVPGISGYDVSLSGIENMRRMFDAMNTKDVARHLALDGSSGETSRTPVRYGRHVDLHAYKADSLFEDMLVRSDGDMDEANVADATVGGQQAGYMKQLLGMVGRPDIGRIAYYSQIDRIMSYSKAASVGISAFFAFATRFESPVASSGLWHALAGFTDSSLNTDKCAKAMRKIGDAFGRAGQTGAFSSDAVFLTDMLRAITSNDPYVREMRELCDLIGMPLTDSVQNPVTDKMGAIDRDIERTCRWAERALGVAYSKRIRAGFKAALHNPSEYAFSNVLNGVKMAVVSQALRTLREQCREQNRPFDPVKELRRHAAYINAEIGGIDPGRYAFLTPQTQRVLGRSMFSYQWTLGAWAAGAGDAFTDLVFGGHHTTPEMRRFAFIRWLRMLGYIKIGVPVVMQIAVKALATAIAAAKGNPPGDDDDPYGIEAMPWLCFNNEEKIGPLSFDITPLLRLAGSNETLSDIKLKKGGWPYVSAVAGAAIGYGITKGPVGALIGAAVGATSGDFVPAYVGRGKNNTGNRRYYMHFGKQSDEFWRWFTEPWQQATGKLSIPAQKTVEAFFGTTNGSSFSKPFTKKSLSERFFTLNMNPNESATANFFTAFLPFSAASVAGHPDAGVLGMIGPVQMGASKTYVQKKIVDRLVKFAEDDRHSNPWAHPSNRASLETLCKDILDDADKNGVDPKDILTSAIGQAASREYGKLFAALPRSIDDNQFDVPAMTAALRALARLGRRQQAILMALGKRYKAAGVDWEAQPNAKIAEMVRELVEGVGRDPYNWGERQYAELTDRYSRSTSRDVRRVDVRQVAKGGTDLAGFLATDDVPDTLFGIPVVSGNYTEDDLEFFRDNPDAGGYYDMGDEPDIPPDPDSPDPTDGGSPARGTSKGGEASDEYVTRVNAAVKSVIPFLKEHEGFRKDAYLDSQNKPTIGYGQRTMNDREVTMDDRGMTEEEASAWLERRVKDNAYTLMKRHAWMERLSPGALAAAYDLAYNLGDGIFSEKKSPTFNRRLADGEDPETVFWSELPTYTGGKDATEQTRKGLTNRRNDAKAAWQGVELAM